MMTRFGTIGLWLLLLVGPAFAQNPYYDHGSYPSGGSLGSSAAMRAELDLIEAGFAKLPTISGNASKIVIVNSGATALTATDAPIPSGATFPSSPSTHALFLITDDSVQGACDSAAGAATTLCRWDGAAWTAVGSSAVSGWPTVSTVKEITWANALANAVKLGNGTDYWAFYRDPTTGLQLTCVVGGVENACNYARKLSATYYWELQNNSGTSILRVSNDTGAITNATLDAEATGNTITLTEEQWYNVVSCQNATPAHIHDTPTANIPEALCDTGSNTQKGHAAFDATTDESISGHWVLPTGFTGAIDIKGKYKIAATTGAVGWCFQMIRVADGSTSDPAFPAQAAGNCTSDTVKGTTLQENDFTITGVTCTSCAAGDHVYWRLSRDANGGAVTDDAAGDAFLQTFGRVWRVAH